MYSPLFFVLALAVLLCGYPTYVSAAGGAGGCVCRMGGKAVGKAKSEARACTMAMMKCPSVSRCARGYVCKGKPKCRIGAKSVKRILKIKYRLVWKTIKGKKVEVRVPVKTFEYVCRIRCKPHRRTMCVKPGGRGDPHLTGFDGIAFDFHGEHGKYYMMFGYPTGDVLVTRMRSAKKWDKNGMEKTYFDEFGLKIVGSDNRIALSLVEDREQPGEWQVELKVNDMVVDNGMEIGSTRIQQDVASGSVTVQSSECEYVFRARHLDSAADRHLDVELSLLDSPKQAEIYEGVLGVTLNKALGKEIADEIGSIQRGTAFEKVLRERYEVDSLFPHSLNGVARDVVWNAVNAQQRTSWTAKTSHD